MAPPSIWSEKEERDLQKLLLANDEGDLAGALLAIEGCDTSTEEQVRHQLTQFSNQVQLLLETNDSIHPAEALRQVLVEDHDFRGETDEYYHPQNSFLSRVCERRRGLPILLSAIWVVVGRMAGLRVEGVGMPGHFLILVDDEEPLFVDPFDDGQTVTVDDCKAIIKRVYQDRLPWKSDYLDPLSDTLLVNRVLNNLLNAFHQQDDIASLYFVVRILSNLHPLQANLLWHQGRLAERYGDDERARQAYLDYVEKFPKGKYFEQAEEKINEEPDESDWMN